MIQVDIATRVVGVAEDFYMVRPGTQFHFYDDFKRGSHVFLDFPDLGLGQSAAFPAKSAARKMVAKSLAILDWHLSGRNGAKPTQASAKGKRIGKYVGAIQRLHFQMPIGAIIIVPGPGYYSDVLIGEVVGRPTELTIGEYGDLTLLARKVKWRARRPKYKFSKGMIDVLQNRNPVVQIPRNLRGEVLDISFGQYVLGELFTSRIQTVEEDFSSLNDFDIQKLVNFVAGTLFAYNSGYTGPKIRIDKAIDFLRNNRDEIPEFNSNINSPGFIRYLANTVKPITIAVLLSLALSGCDMTDPISVKNSLAAIGDACTIEVEAQVKGVISMIHIPDLLEACDRFVESAEETGLKTSIKVTEVSDGE